MPPGGGQGGTGKKGGAGSIRQAPRSRNTTPSVTAEPATSPLPPVENQDTEYLDLSFELFRDIQYEDLVDANTSSGGVLPDSRSLDGIVTRLQQLQDIIEKRGLACDKGMRLLAVARKARAEDLAEKRGREEERRAREAAADEERERRANKKKRKATEALAPQETNHGESKPFVRVLKFALLLQSLRQRVCSHAMTPCVYSNTYLKAYLLRLI
jgi:transcriptional adapter 3